MNVSDYLANNFPENVLRGSLITDWPAKLHFDLAKGIYQFNADGTYNEEMFQVANQEAMNVINEMIDEEDELFFVINVYWKRSYEKTRILTNYFTNKQVIFKATSEQFPMLSEDEPAFTRISVPCRKSDIKLKKLVEAIGNEDFNNRTPRFIRTSKNRYPEVYLVNRTKDLFVYMYDDRGIEVVYKEFEMIPLKKAHR
ncbi:hypothetical protein ACFSFY_16660 [Sporosarcina siberiensis]|uniref:DUF3885 domain-containing protein n=1 Tax=Sporosarcina siberiensis TaxID=1365606 RepID=A0ABW4SJG2_9BACL